MAEPTEPSIRAAAPGPAPGAGAVRLRRLLRSHWYRLWNLWDRATSREISLIAAGVAFFGFLAIFPALAAVIAIWGFASDPGVIRGQIALLADVLPPEAYSLLAAQIEVLLAANNRSFGWTTALSTALALWSARAGMAALMQGVNAIHGFPARSGVVHVGLALLMTLVLVGLVLAAMALTVVAPLVILALPLGPATALALKAANVGLGLCVVVVAIALIYRIGPNRLYGRRPPLLTRGLFVALAMWVAVSQGLVLYLANFASYNRIYGSIGAVAALLLWFYLSATAILLGAAVDAERAARRARRAAQ
jgi:membrane protein